MKDADIVLYSSDSTSDGALVVSDRYAKNDNEAPVADALLSSTSTDDVVNVDAEGPRLQSGVWHVTFTRPLVTNDPYDFQFDSAEPDKSFYLLAAYKNANRLFLAKHTGVNHTAVKLLSTRDLPDSFFDAPGVAAASSANATAAPSTAAKDDDDDDDKAAEVAPHVTHGTLMMLAWVLLGTANTYVARYLKPLGDVWFRAHVAVGFAIAVGCVTALWVIVAHVQADGESHFESVHARTGLALLLFTVLQLALGYLAHARYNAARPHAPIYPDRLHWYLGRGLLVLSYATALLGVQQAGGGLGFRQWPSALLIVCVMLACALFVAADTRYLAGRRRGEEESALAETLKRWLFGWIVATGGVVFTIAALLEKV